MSTCADCAHFKRCEWLVSCQPDNTSCDWSPSRFVQLTSANDAKSAVRVCLCGHTEGNHTERDGCLCHVNGTGEAGRDHVYGQWCSCASFQAAGSLDLEAFLMPQGSGAVQ